MPYRDDLSAHQEHAQRLAEELAATRRELAELRAKYAKAMAVLRVVAEGKKLEKLLEERRSSLPPASAVGKPLEERPSSLPPAGAEGQKLETPLEARRSSRPPATAERKKLEKLLEARRSSRPPARDAADD
ncbi:MAG: hypothetical protein KC586_07545 [Myxococcales bacterium]|nr:hypothetical protein [Myxococcales bacterium]